MSTSHNANEVARTALDLAQTLANVEDMQWQAAPSTRPSERVGGSRSDVSDPTFAIVADDRRSALRDMGPTRSVSVMCCTPGAGIARLLTISPKTVDTYKQRINEKLGLAHRADYVKLALRLGLLQS